MKKNNFTFLKNREMNLSSNKDSKYIYNYIFKKSVKKTFNYFFVWKYIRFIKFNFFFGKVCFETNLFKSSTLEILFFLKKNFVRR